ncbi:hypothetical protein Nepgr_004558 [Nepenthes gracilis]|uniref:Uncharacterized protein n=1 Tax=Nepenthes gracilis TaxID=150966 RepID=A0AAD3S1M0_NEPGR|nr:hypothetical protein Nepgr_004558 [Nepenthes gracilis]
MDLPGMLQRPQNNYFKIPETGKWTAHHQSSVSLLKLRRKLCNLGYSRGFHEAAPFSEEGLGNAILGAVHDPFGHNQFDYSQPEPVLAMHNLGKFRYHLQEQLQFDCQLHRQVMLGFGWFYRPWMTRPAAHIPAKKFEQGQFHQAGKM